MKNFFMGLALIFCLTLTGCEQDKRIQENLDGAYSLALKLMIETDSALNQSTEFIAVDMQSFTKLTAEDKTRILYTLERKYGVKAMDASFEDLQALGLFNKETESLTGILLTIEKVDYHFNGSLTFTGAKMKSGLGAIGVESVLKFDGVQWKIQEFKQTWVS